MILRKQEKTTDFLSNNLLIYDTDGTYFFLNIDVHIGWFYILL